MEKIYNMEAHVFYGMELPIVWTSTLNFVVCKRILAVLNREKIIYGRN